MNAARRKHQVLQDFTKIMFDRNPMQLNLAGNPHAEDEYESEALSVLSRFNEGVLHLCHDKDLQKELATSIVMQAFGFWFGGSEPNDPEGLASDLLKTYASSYPRSEQHEPVEVLSTKE